MEFGFSAAETAFADEVRRFLREHPLESFLPDGMDAGYGSGSHSRAFMKALAERGWISMGWPAAFGGQKIWSIPAGMATQGLVFTRTSREARRSRGFSMFVVPNGTPGMDIRPIRSLTGGVYHYEVFLDDVRVPAELRLGPEGEGFVALLNGLDSDRFWGRFYKAPALERVLRRLVDYATTTRVAE